MVTAVVVGSNVLCCAVPCCLLPQAQLQRLGMAAWLSDGNTTGSTASASQVGTLPVLLSVSRCGVARVLPGRLSRPCS